MVPVLRDAICSLETTVNAMSAQAPTEISWKEVSERVASEVGNASEKWVNERMATEVERVIQTRSTSSPVPSVPYSCNLRGPAAWANAAHSDMQQSASADKAATDETLSDTRKDLRGLQKYLKLAF